MRLAEVPYCIDCKQERLLDVTSGVEIESQQIAPLLRRFRALMIDWFLVGAAAFLVYAMLAIYVQPGTLRWLLVLLYVGFYFLYEGLMLSRSGQTVGKLALHLRVISVTGGKLSIAQAFGRAAVRMSLFSYLRLFDYIPALFNRERTTLHDLIARTRVVSIRS